MERWKRNLIILILIFIGLSSPGLVVEAVHGTISILHELSNTAKQVGNGLNNGKTP